MSAMRGERTGADWLREATWRGHVFSSGWHALEKSADVVEPATGEVIGKIGMAGPADVARAATTARQAQSETFPNMLKLEDR